MKYLLIIFILLLLNGCIEPGYQYKHVPNPDAIKYGFHLKEIDSTTYDLSFIGSPGSTLEYAIETWDARAEHLCSANGYIMLNSSKSTETGTVPKTTKPIFDDAGVSAIGGAGGFIGGVIVALLSTEFVTEYNTNYPKVQGLFKCKTESQSNKSPQPTAESGG